MQKELEFNNGEWPRLIESQAKLIDVKEVVRLSSEFRRNFWNSEVKPAPLPIMLEALCETARSEVSGTICGYDIPTLISRGPESRQRIVLCFQDPKRPSNSQSLTASTPFGVAWRRYREGGRSYRVVWEIVKLLDQLDFDVWLTDAWKLWLENQAATERLKCVQKDILSKEMNKVKPVAMFVFGGEAAKSVKFLRESPEVSSFPIHQIIHPSIRTWHHIVARLAASKSVAGTKREQVIEYYRREIADHLAASPAIQRRLPADPG